MTHVSSSSYDTCHTAPGECGSSFHVKTSVNQINHRHSSPRPLHPPSLPPSLSLSPPPSLTHSLARSITQPLLPRHSALFSFMYISILVHTLHTHTLQTDTLHTHTHMLHTHTRARRRIRTPVVYRKSIARERRRHQRTVVRTVVRTIQMQQVLVGLGYRDNVEMSAM